MAVISAADATAILDWLSQNQFRQMSSVRGDDSGFGDRREVWEPDGSLIRVTRDRGQWFCDISRAGASCWFDVDDVVDAMRYKQNEPVERVAVVAAVIDDRLLAALDGEIRRSPA